MYSAYFVNVITGQLWYSASPKFNKSDEYYPKFNAQGWSRINEDLYNTFRKVQSFVK